MEFWIILGILLLIGYFIYKASPEYQKRLKEQQIEQLESRAEYWFNYVIEKARDDIKEYEKDNNKVPGYDPLKTTQETIEELKELRQKYLTLKERFKHASFDERLALARDWYDLNEIQWSNRIDYEHHVKWADFYNMPSSKEEKVKEREKEERLDQELGIQVKEILKRFDEKLSG